MADVNIPAILEKTKNSDLTDLLKEMEKLKIKYKLKCLMYDEKVNTNVLQAVRPKDIASSSYHSNEDKTLLKLIQEESILDSIDTLKRKYNIYRNLVINKLVEYSGKKTIAEMIVIYREQMHFKWEDIAYLVKYSRSQTIDIYHKEKNRTKSDDD